MTPPLVTTIIPVFNRSTFLRDAVESVIAQSWRPIEIIIVDDGSTDDTRETAEELRSQHPEEVRVISQENRGPGAAREAGRQEARGEFLQYLDSDDLLLPRKFEMQVGGLLANPDCGISYGYTRLRRVDGSYEPAPWKGSGVRRDSMFPSFLLSRWWDTSNPIYRRDLCEKAGPWIDSRLEEDWEYDCRIAALHPRLHFCEDWVMIYRAHDQGNLSRGSATDPARLRDRARAHELIFRHAVRAGVEVSAPEMRHYARELFLLARQCGSAGLAPESRRLFTVAQEASEPRLVLSVYRAGAGILGWTTMARLASLTDHLRR